MLQNLINIEFTLRGSDHFSDIERKRIKVDYTVNIEELRINNFIEGQK